MQIPILIGVEGEAREIVETFNAGLFYEPENKCDFLKKLEKISIYENQKLFSEGGKKLAQFYNRKTLATEMLNILTKS